MFYPHKLAVIASALCFFSFSSLQAVAEEKDPKDEIEKASYIIGFSYGTGMKRDLGELNLEQIMQGFKHGFEGQSSLITAEESKQIMSAFQQKKRAEMQEKQSKQASENLSKGKAFLDQNAKEDGVKTTDSGLQYKVIKAGEGQAPGPRDVVKVHYEGTLIDGSVFDSSKQRGQPIEFSVDGVIAGWTEALQMMTPGAQWKLFIPPDLAYGENGTSGPIGPNETLIFDVELLEVSKREQAQKSE